MSRSAPRMEQQAAIKAGLFHVLPVTENGMTYQMVSEQTDHPRMCKHILVATDITGKVKWRTTVHQVIYIEELEGDVQDVFVVDLYLKEEYVAVKLEYREPYYFSKETGIKKK
ncbi:MAG: hypothetical protein JST43_04770 [Bacteroidetes bacterium]|nr:hypothetical protein [Bacteroidota bacterium]MBS1539863.1 hypothetical protein [Bacteroidota bacterium]